MDGSIGVTWMAKIGRESNVTAIFEKLTTESRKEPGCLMYQVHKHKTIRAGSLSMNNIRTMPPSKVIAPRRISCSWQKRST